MSGARLRPFLPRAKEGPAIITAIVLFRVDPPLIQETARAIAETRGVTEVYSVTGDWELVAMLRVKTHEEIADVVTGDIVRLEGVKATRTMIAFRTYTPSDLERLWGVGFEGPDS